MLKKYKDVFSMTNIQISSFLDFILDKNNARSKILTYIKLINK